MKPTGKGKPCARGARAVKQYNGVPLPSDATQRRRLRNKLSAQVHRKRRQDALNRARQEVQACDAVIAGLKMRLSDTRAKISSLQAVMDAIEAEFGAETVGHIFEECQPRKGGEVNVSGIDNGATARPVASDSEINVLSSPSSSPDDDKSL